MAEIIRIEELMERQAAEQMTKLEFEARKVYLEAYAGTVRRLEEMAVELEEAEQNIGPGAYAATGMPRGGKVSDGSDRIIARMEQIRRLTDSIRRDMRRLAARRDEIAGVIDGLSAGKLQEVLYYRYIRDMDLGAIAEKTNYSYRQVQNIHNRAVQRIKPPRNAIARIKAELMEEHPEWAGMQMRTA